MSETRVTDPITGAQKGTKDERYDLIPWGWATDEIARVYAFGAIKYADHNWRKGYKWSLSMAALMRHIVKWASGETLDPESGLHHLAHAGFHILSLLTYHVEHPWNDDRYKKVIDRVDEPAPHWDPPVVVERPDGAGGFKKLYTVDL